MARLHQSQRKIAESSSRFKVLRCGRRFGKTTYAVEEMKGACLFEPGPVAYFATTRDQARDIVWAELLENVIGTSNYVTHNEQRLEVTLRRPDGSLNRIRLFGWENIETARGKKYSLVVLDELDSMRAFEKQWREIIRATLADYRGRALFMGTPKGYKSLYRLEKLSKTNANYEVFHFTSFDNPFLSVEELDEMRGEMTVTQYAQEMLAEYHKMEGLIYEEFNRDQHIKALPFTPERWALSIDFGYNHPFAAGIFAIGSDNSLHLDRMVYKRKLSDEQRMNAVRDLIGDTKLDFQIGDSEDPLAIDTLNRQLGLKIQPVVKGAGSVLEGINKSKSLLHQGRLTMDPSCEDLAWEKENYSWKLDKNDEPLDEPVKQDDDACDMERYAVITIHGTKKKEFRVRTA
ncbi:terminase large subunit [Rhodococcus sp. NPDC056516]|uniref:terminase large subunit n=1 Tax=Rhodococcus sp. NPDC056516 TaxID=3345847 RepID=UPI0036718D79